MPEMCPRCTRDVPEMCPRGGMCPRGCPRVWSTESASPSREEGETACSARLGAGVGRVAVE